MTREGHCPGCRCLRPLPYGPVGNPESSDPFEWAQARAPEGWHVEGHVVYGKWKATTKGCMEQVSAMGAPALVDAMLRAGPR